MNILNKYLLVVCFCIPFFAGCSNDDGYSLGKFWVEIASVVPTEGNNYYVQLDNGKKLWPAASTVKLPYSRTRAQVNYTILSDSEGPYDHYVKVNYINYILTKNISEYSPEEEEFYGNDKIKILEFWEGDDFLNIHFGVNIGGIGSDGTVIVHSINMVDRGINEEGVIELELRHNMNGDTEKYGATGLVAFDLRPYKDELKESIQFKIKLNSFTGSESEYDFTYKYAGTKDSYDKPIMVGETNDLEIK